MSLIPSFEVLPVGCTVAKRLGGGGAIVECNHDPSHRVEPDPRSSTRFFPFCGICRGDAKATQQWSRPVKLMAVVPDGPTQLSLT